jgi:predicted hydrocarbon binding protein
LLSRKFSSVRDAEKAARFGLFYQRGGDMDKSARIEYLPDQSKTDEHHFRVLENSDCCGFEGIGTCIASHIPPAMAGAAIAFEQAERDWNAIETKCIGLGDPHCEVILVPAEIPGLYESLVKDNQTIAGILNRMFGQIMGYILENKPLPGRPILGDEVYLHVAFHQMGFPHLAGERYQMAQRMGGAKTGRELGDRLLKAGLEPDEALHKVIDFMNACKVGLVEAAKSITIQHNIESLRTKFWTEIDQPCCYFTTGFFNGLYRSLKGQHVREIKCQAAGDAYCEWLVE